MTTDLIETMARAMRDAVTMPPRTEAAVSMLRAALKAAEEAGWVLVPKEPTPEMWAAGLRHLDSPSSNRAWWDALIAARPKG